MRVHNLPVNLCASTVAKLQDWLLDEIIPTPLPMYIRLSQVKLHLEEDRPPPAGCPQQPPVDMNIPSINIARNKDGVFEIKVEDDGGTCQQTMNDVTRPPLQDQLDEALAEVRVLRARLAEMEGQVRQKGEENEMAERRLDQATSQINALVVEKASLMDTLKYLQQELVKSGKKL